MQAPAHGLVSSVFEVQGLGFRVKVGMISLILTVLHWDDSTP